MMMFLEWREEERQVLIWREVGLGIAFDKDI
jgi:hypothetical protein